MLFKNAEGVYVEILRSQYTNDTAYYTSIMKNAKANEMGANEMANANEMGANEIETSINEARINEMSINETSINEMTRIKSLVYKTLKHI